MYRDTRIDRYVEFVCVAVACRKALQERKQLNAKKIEQLKAKSAKSTMQSLKLFEVLRRDGDNKHQKI